MTALIVIAAIVVILALPITVSVGFDKEMSLSVRYLFLKMKILPEEQKAEKKKQPAKKKEKPPPKKLKLESLTSALDWTALRFDRLFKIVKKLLRRTTVAKLNLLVTVSGEDAADTAIKYGKTNALVYTAISMLDSMITLKADKVDIIPGFDGREAQIIFSFKIKIIPLAVITAGLNIGLWFLCSVIKGSARPKKQSERTEIENGK